MQVELKRNPKISLVSVHTAPSPQALPLATAFLKSAAKDIPVDITLIDFFIGAPPDGCARAISDTLPDSVGFSMYVWNRELCLNIANQLRKLIPDVKLFAGGPEATADPEGVLNTGVFDFIFCGEGEIPFRILCQRLVATLETGDIPGIILPGRAGTNPSVAPITSDLELIPSPYLSEIIDTRCYPGILWQLSRGCCFSCDFCFDSSGRSGVRRFSPERVEAELKLFAAAGVSQVFVLDSTFNQDVKRAKTILRMIRRIASGIHFHFEVRSEFIDREMAGLFAKITCSLQIGLQSSDPSVLAQVNRKFNRDDFCYRVSMLNESGAVFGFDLIYGLPGDTLQGFCDSLDFSLSLYPNHLDIFPLSILPGTALHLRGGAIELEHLSVPPYTLISSPTFSIDDMRKARLIANACDVFYTRGKAVAWFIGVLTVLEWKPSDFLRKFADLMFIGNGIDFNENELDDIEVWNLQRKFLIQTFSSRRLKRFLNLVLDLVDYHFHYAAALLAPQHELCHGRKPDKKILESQLRRGPSLQMSRFHYNIIDIIEVGVPDIRWMGDHLEPAGSYAAIYKCRDNVNTQTFDYSYYKLLESMDGQTNAGELASRFEIPPEDAIKFFRFAIQEGFVIL